MKPLLLTFVLSLTVLLCHADPTPDARTITVAGQATIKVTPDEMQWDTQVTVVAANRTEAKQAYDLALTSALAYLNKTPGIKDLQTSGLRIAKEYRYSAGSISNSKSNTVYTCATSITFTLTDLDKYGEIVDALAPLANFQVNSTNYDYSKEAQTAKEALVKAQDDAKATATLLADNAGYKLSGVRSIQVISGYQPRPMMAMVMAPAMGGAMSSSTPPTVAGQIEIGGNVSVTYDIATK